VSACAAALVIYTLEERNAGSAEVICQETLYFHISGCRWALERLSLLTPCVFPMIPITVSYFANHSSVTRVGAIRKAAMYGLGIMLTFVVLGMSLALFFGAAGINKLAANPWVNLLITGIF